MYRKRKYSFRIYIPLAMFLLIAISIFILRGLFFNRGLAQYRDLSWPYISDYWSSFGNFVWDSYFQTQVQIQQKSIYLWLSQFPPEISERLIYLIIFIVMDVTMFHVTYKFTKSIMASVISTLFFIFNPVVITRVQHRLLLLSYALLPLFFYLTFRLFRDISKKGKFESKHIIFISILWLLMSTSPHWALFSALIIFYNFVTALFFAKVKMYKYLKKSITAFSVITVLYIGLSSFWIIPYFLQSTLSSLHPPYVFTKEALSSLSINAQLLNVIRLDSYWWPGDLFSNPPLSSVLWIVTTFASSLLATISLLFVKSYKEESSHVVMSIAVLLPILVFLSKGVNSPLGEAYTFLCFKIPLVSSIGWLFRDPHKWTFLLSFCYSLLIGFLVLRILRIRNVSAYKFKYILILILFIIPLVIGYPLLTGDLNGRMRPQPVPHEYKQLDQWLREQGESFKVVLYPKSPPWGVAKPTIQYNSYLRFSINSLLNNRTSKFGALLNPWSVRYIIVRTEPSKSEVELRYFLMMFNQSKSFINSLKYQDDINFVKKFGTLYVFENLDYSAPVGVSMSNMAILGDFSIFNSLSQLNLLNKELMSAYFLSQNNVETSFSPFSKVILNENIGDIIFNYMMTRNHDPKIIQLFDFTIHHNPSKLWSKASTSDPLHGDWHPYLKGFGIENWQFDYGYGLVFTWATRNIPQRIIPKEQDLIKHWSFDNQRESLEWKSNTPEKQFNAIQKLMWENGALKAELYNSTWGWKTIRSPFIPAKFGDALRFSLKIKGENAQSVHIKVFEFDKNKKYLTGEYVMGVGSGNFDWKTVTFDYIVQNSNTSYIQLQIWHGHETKQPLPNEIWIDDVKVYNITKYTKPITLEIPFKVDKPNNYKLFVRYFKNQKGGEIRVYLDGKPIEIKTKDQLNKFVWKDLGTFHLKAGDHKIVLENVKGFNAVNLFALIPEKEYYKALKDVKGLLQNKTILYLFEAESDLYRSNAKTIKSINASNGELITFGENGKAWQDVEIIKNGTYRIALKEMGEFKVKIGNYSFMLKSNTLNFTYTPPFYLNEGKYRLEITPLDKASKLDTVWLYSSNKTIDQLFQVKEKPAQVQSYKKINPTLWKVRVNATNPFMLSFAESYAPLWEARVYRDGKLVEKVKPVPLYSVINGFWINETGNLEIVIRYKPQDWFEKGLIISLTTFILSIFYLFYDWRRERGDEWAKRLERKVKKILRRQ